MFCWSRDSSTSSAGHWTCLCFDEVHAPTVMQAVLRCLVWEDINKPWTALAVLEWLLVVIWTTRDLRRRRLENKRWRRLTEDAAASPSSQSDVATDDAWETEGTLPSPVLREMRDRGTKATGQSPFSSVSHFEQHPKAAWMKTIPAFEYLIMIKHQKSVPSNSLNWKPHVPVKSHSSSTWRWW